MSSRGTNAERRPLFDAIQSSQRHDGRFDAKAPAVVARRPAVSRIALDSVGTMNGDSQCIEGRGGPATCSWTIYAFGKCDAGHGSDQRIHSTSH
jgi:hypothetical protein